MALKIVWTEKANIERQQILQFWIEHNKSKVFSLKLDNLLISSIRDIARRPNIGRKTEFDNVRIKIVRKYQIFYEVIIRDLIILPIWDGRRDRRSLKVR